MTSDRDLYQSKVRLQKWKRFTAPSAEVVERCYQAEWSDMRSMAMNVCELAGRTDLAERIASLEQPPSGDK